MDFACIPPEDYALWVGLTAHLGTGRLEHQPGLIARAGRRKGAGPGPSECDLRRELDQSSREYGLRLQPRSTRDEGVVVGEHRAGVESVVEIDPDHRARAPELQDFRRAEVELVDAIAIPLTGRKDIDRDVGRVAGRGATKNPRDLRAWNSVVRRKQRPWLALEDAAELDVDFRNDVGRQRPQLRQPAVVDVAVRVCRAHG